MASMERFTQRARRVLSLAHKEAEKANKESLGTEDLLLGLLVEEGGVAGRVLHELGLDVERVREIVQRVTDDQPQTSPSDTPKLAPDTQKVLEYAIDEARSIGHHYIGTEHLLLALTRSEGTVKFVFDKLGLTSDQIRKQVRRILNEGSSSSPTMQRGKRTSRQAPAKKGPKTPLVDQLATDLTALAEEKKLDPVIGRQTEIERVIQILARRTKNNPALIGEPGVGKTAIVEGLAQRIVDGDVPAPLMKKQVMQLDVGSLVAGTMYRGQFEERLKRVIDELKKSGAILFIDEVHMLVGAGSAGSAVDAANILKPALSRGELQVIGATTLDEYRKSIESDAALERRFQSVMVEEPSEEETVAILKGIRKAYEDHHHLVISDEALEAATQLSSRYISERFLPDKAIDLIDESSSRVRMYKSPAAKEAKDLYLKLKETKQTRTLAQEEGEEAEALAAIDTALTEIEEKIEKLRTGWDRATSPVVSEEDIAEMVSMWTGVPLMQLAQEETERLLQMEDELREHIIGQDEAIDIIARAVRRARAGLKDPQRPIGSLMFLGPTGVGKTELTKALAKFMFGSADAAIQLDMSEFMERHTASRLVGAPPGYVGYDDAGQLTEALRRRPYSIVVFDEVEKAHGEVHNMLLQIMEEGHLSDARGRKVDFSNAIIVMTSNVGAEMIKKQGSLGFQLKQDKETEDRLSYEDMRKKLTETLKREFRPEFINRLDGVVVFRALNEENIQQIVSIELDKVSARLVNQGLTLTATPVALTHLGELGYDPEFGARPLKRIIQQKVEDPLSDAVLAGDFSEGDTVLVDLDDDGEIILTKELAPAMDTEPEPVV
ncbi:MAG: ATP-dependent Clp protease ATP-binding subunit [Anaerolineae bacterium]|jgi:ATP-dependent Clp protease ATP-binding subunit ClpC|nr:ATP-dependent Clp protease ATP-binding subunit [Anaerolineae bacterium]MBT4310191.1 ATP-dependent Clp protease ATP-binding subunit [Anaerolineae bacterium]MBT4457642.1 ATP-dependent Clp protease ATP-binding subunit [Anaerolineae bacterium]MBT4841137.1 ATP-dependent Clp protease ATP-binding subunit [Anaerolineae bacterium]MBT6062328.1 ATP-dependent Clp protease ATP-binding subunit [Anaerolineae bacterium]